MTYKCNFVGGALDGQTLELPRLYPFYECLPVDDDHYNGWELPPVQTYTAAKRIGAYEIEYRIRNT